MAMMILSKLTMSMIIGRIGCFENYPTMIFHDVAMSKVVECGEWLAFYDQLNSKITSNFEYEVGGYMPYVLVNFHRFFAGSVRQKIEYPRKDYEVYLIDTQDWLRAQEE